MKKIFFAIMVAIATVFAEGCRGNDALKFKAEDSSKSYEIAMDSLSSMILSNDGNAHCWDYDSPDCEYSVLIFIEGHPVISKVQFLFGFDDDRCLNPVDCFLELSQGEKLWIKDPEKLRQLTKAVSPVLYATLDECLDVNYCPQDDEWQQVETLDSDWKMSENFGHLFYFSKFSKIIFATSSGVLSHVSITKS